MDAMLHNGSWFDCSSVDRLSMCQTLNAMDDALHLRFHNHAPNGVGKNRDADVKFRLILDFIKHAILTGDFIPYRTWAETVKWRGFWSNEAKNTLPFVHREVFQLFRKSDFSKSVVFTELCKELLNIESSIQDLSEGYLNDLHNEIRLLVLVKQITADLPENFKPDEHQKKSQRRFFPCLL